MDYKIYDTNGNLVNTIYGSEAFVIRYCEKCGYTYEEIAKEPLPEPGPTAQDDANSLLVDHEYRITLLELGVNE